MRSAVMIRYLAALLASCGTVLSAAPKFQVVVYGGTAGGRSELSAQP